MLVYRMETVDGNGPYQSERLTEEQNSLLREMRWDHNDDYIHISPWQESKLRGIRIEERCGFVSLQQLKDWFAGWFDILAESEFLVTVYDVPADAVRTGTFQAVITNLHFYSQVAAYMPDDLPED